MIPTMRPTLFISNIAWDFVWQRHQTLASLFARDGRVIFCEIPGIRRVGLRDAPRVLARLRRFAAPSRPADAGTPPPAGLTIMRPFVLPATNPLFCAWNARQMRRFAAAQPELRAGVDLVVDYSASRTALQLLDCVPHRRLVYDCTDDWLAVRGIPSFLRDDERALLARADLTLVPSQPLLERKAPAARRIARVPHGVLLERFLVPARPAPAAGTVNLLYYGHLHRQHVDFAAIDRIARARLGWRIVLLGPVRTPHAFPPNVVLGGQQPHERLRDAISAADVLLLPYAVNAYTQAVMPAKSYECLATGRPIVAAPLPQLTADFAGEMAFADAPEAWVPAIERVLRDDTPAARAARIAVAEANTWEQRYAEIRRLLAGLETAPA